MTSTLFLLLTALTLMSCSVIGKRTAAEPPYSVEHRDGDFEIRSYASMIVASTVVNGSYGQTSNKAFGRLAGYIIGRNTGKQKISMTAPVIQEAEGEKIAMTAPVIQAKEGSAWRMEFVMPEEYTMETLPKPLDPDVIIREIPARKVATVRYSGLHSARNIDSWSARLKAWLEQEGYRSLSRPRAASYDPPWTIPFFRRNEIHIDVE